MLSQLSEMFSGSFNTDYRTIGYYSYIPIYNITATKIEERSKQQLYLWVMIGHTNKTNKYRLQIHIYRYRYIFT